MKLEIKRPIKVYLYDGLWIYMTILYGIKNSTIFGRSILILMACIGAVSFISVLIKRNYFEIKDKELIINKSFFRTQSVQLNEIDRVEIEPSPFVSSKIYLKDGRLIKYLDSIVNEKSIKELLGPFNIPVE